MLRKVHSISKVCGNYAVNKKGQQGPLRGAATSKEGRASGQGDDFRSACMPRHSTPTPSNCHVIGDLHADVSQPVGVVPVSPTSVLL